MQHIVGLDMGYGFTKAVVSDGRRIKFPTWIAIARPGSYTELPTYHLNGTAYWIGEAAAYGERLEINAVQDLVLFYPLFRQYVLDVLDLSQATVITGLPPKDYFETAYRNQLPDTALWQGLGVLIDMKDHLSTASSVAVLDIGFNTVDYVIVQRIHGKWQKVKAGSIPHAGTMRALNLFKDALPSDLSFLRFQSKQALVKAFEEQKFKYLGQTIDLSTYATKALKEYSSLLDTMITAELDSYLATTDRLVLAGGGAYYYKPKHQALLIPQDPEFSNARGYLKWAENQ